LTSIRVYADDTLAISNKQLAISGFWGSGDAAIPPFDRMRYSKSMNVAIEFNPAAFKHGVREADIRLAIMNAPFTMMYWTMQTTSILC
jgi:hypothetical protein